MEKAQLSNGDSTQAHARVSVAAMWRRLEELEAVAHDPGKVKTWAGDLWRDLGKCKAF